MKKRCVWQCCQAVGEDIPAVVVSQRTDREAAAEDAKLLNSIGNSYYFVREFWV